MKKEKLFIFYLFLIVIEAIFFYDRLLFVFIPMFGFVVGAIVSRVKDFKYNEDYYNNMVFFVLIQIIIVFFCLCYSFWFAQADDLLLRILVSINGCMYASISVKVGAMIQYKNNEK
jgi:hypothetical protein